ncbi:hypothetical protein C8A00DRAFT_47631 [Chaetomidium leptoderma]|uniref:Nucleoside phosphorylase domain-containing protein n=1 Tax=Chaetomidium leptoderma TaxID=669021 RepID=A0AAN6ZSF4_9PEZI|nr:hypothetical protein C8A00DRAFT_47631 [Chaetomidium leptoderma]
MYSTRGGSLEEPTTVEDHTMGASLVPYLAIKMHQEITARVYNAIVVLGSYNRSDPSIIFEGEKCDKPFNWQRPTARIVGDKLWIECFPGYDHNEHYARLIASYLGILHREGRIVTPPSNVSFIPSSCSDTRNALEATNLRELPTEVDTVVLGLVHRLDRLTGTADWKGNGCFGWAVRQFNGRQVAFVGCRPSFWGDIAGEVVHHITSRRHRVREVLYFGKLGSLRNGIKPNTFLATGGRSYVRGQIVEWNNPLEASVTYKAADDVIFGDHITVGSVLHETRDWLTGLPPADFVDSEVGMMAQAAVRSGVDFGYLHIISDNVTEKYEQDLSNERIAGVLARRARLYEVAQDVLEHHLTATPRVECG